MSPKVSGRLSVKEVAELAGITPRAVRHYHAIGVLPEPQRDGSGYRRYGGKDVIDLVRVARLRALGMPLPQIAERISAGDSDTVSLSEALEALAGELDAEIDRLVATRDRIRELAGSQTFGQPVVTLTQALQERGLLGPADHLRGGEQWAVTVLDALHPDGIAGVLAQAGTLLGDSTAMAALGPLRRRLGKLSSRSSDAEVAALAADVAAILPAGDVDGRLDIGLVDLLLTDRLNPTQQRFVHQLRARMQAAR